MHLGRGICLALLAATTVATSACNAGLKTSGDKLATALTPAPDGAELVPAAPANVFWVRIRSGKVPKKTPDNRFWDEVGTWPDPYVTLSVNGKEIIRTDPSENTVDPAWIGPTGNFKIPSSAELEIFVRDSDPVGDDLLMGRAKFGPPATTQVQAGSVTIDTGRRGKITIQFQPAHAVIGLGFDYWVQNGRLVIKEVWKHSPAGRAGIKAGDEFVAIDGRSIKQMRDRAVRSAINSITTKGTRVIVSQKKGATKTVTLRVGPVYPLFDEYGELD